MIRGRSMHLIDIENQLGTGRITSVAASAFFENYKATVGLGEADQVVVAVSSIEALMELPLSSMRHCRLLCTLGHDGADKALQDVMWNEALPERFPTVICATGDGGFVKAVAHLTSQGTCVIAVAPSRSIAKTMRMATHETIELSSDYPEMDVA
jgi:hypothetical protein